MLDKPRLVAVDDIYIEAPLSGHLTFLKNDDVPGVIGHVGRVLGQSNINIANFSLGREEHPALPNHALEAVSVVETDQSVPDPVLVELAEESGDPHGAPGRVYFVITRFPAPSVRQRQPAGIQVVAP